MKQIPTIGLIVGQVCCVLFGDNDTLVTAYIGTKSIWYGAVV